MGKLERLQYRCLKVIPGAIHGTSYAVLFRELHIHEIGIYPRMAALKYEMKNSDSRACKMDRNSRRPS
jgi:hypothetical protein